MIPVTFLDWTFPILGGYLRLIVWRSRMSWTPKIGGFGEPSRARVLMLPWVWVEASPDPPWSSER